MTSESLVAEYMSTRAGLRRNMITAHSPSAWNQPRRTGLSMTKEAR